MRQVCPVINFLARACSRRGLARPGVEGQGLPEGSVGGPSLRLIGLSAPDPVATGAGPPRRWYTTRSSAGALFRTQNPQAETASLGSQGSDLHAAWETTN